jgi:hypothetical protein
LRKANQRPGLLFGLKNFFLFQKFFVIIQFTGCIGDNDPLDVCEIGSRIHERGSVVRVKVILNSYFATISNSLRKKKRF